MNTLLQNMHFVKGLDPVADFGDTAQSSDVVNMSGHESVVFLIYKGVGTTGTSTITVEACDDVVPTTHTAIPFFYRKYIGSDDVPAALVKATASGFNTTAGSSQLYAVEVRYGDLAALGYKYVRLTMTEVVNSPVLGGVVIIMGNPRMPQDIPASVIV
jgi:hypothetical protein